MHRFFLPKPYAEEMVISGMDAHHIIDVLRMQPGDTVTLAGIDLYEPVSASSAALRDWAATR